MPFNRHFTPLKVFGKHWTSSCYIMLAKNKILLNLVLVNLLLSDRLRWRCHLSFLKMSCEIRKLTYDPWNLNLTHFPCSHFLQKVVPGVLNRPVPFAKPNLRIDLRCAPSRAGSPRRWSDLIWSRRRWSRWWSRADARSRPRLPVVATSCESFPVPISSNRWRT